MLNQPISIAIGDYERKVINEQLFLLPRECKWAIAEMRPGSDLVGHRFTDIFVTVTYPIRETSPKNAEGEPLQHSILKFTVMAPDNSTVMNYERVLAGDAVWRPLPADTEKSSREKAGSSPVVEATGVEPQPPTQPAASELNPQPPEEPTRPNGTYRIGSGRSAPKLISKVEPEYSPEARKAKYSGTVLLSATVGVDGVPRDIKVIKGAGLRSGRAGN